MSMGVMIVLGIILILLLGVFNVFARRTWHTRVRRGVFPDREAPVLDC